MNSIGIRVEPSTVNYCIVESIDATNINIIIIDKIIVPKALDIPNQLSYIRTTFQSILLEYKIKNAGIRIHESNAQNVDIFRIYLEGVFQELFANSTIEKYFLGTMAKFSSLLKTDRKTIKEFFDGNNELIDLSGLDIAKSAKTTRESILTAIAATELL